MLFTTVGSTASALPRRAAGVLAAIVVPVVLSGCVSSGPQNFAALAQTAAQEEVAMEAAAAEEATAAAALAPTARRENGTISGSSAIDRMIAEAADANNIPRDLAFGVVHVESTYNPRARGRGVYGLSQIMPSTARSMGFSGSADDLLEPATNLRYGMRYLAGAWEKGGRDVCRASMKYKGGHRATTMTRSAAAYCGRVRQQMQRIAGNPILRGAPVALAANAPATAAVEVASVADAAPRTARLASTAPATRPAAEAPAANALAANAAPANAASVAIEAAGRSQAAAAVAQPSPRPSDAVAAATVAPAAGPSVPEAAETLSLAEPAAGAEPDPARFGG